MLCLFLNAHHHGSLPSQLKVVWSLLVVKRLRGTYPHLLCSMHSNIADAIYCASWHTVFGVPEFLHWIALAMRDLCCRVYGKLVLLINGDFHKFIIDLPISVSQGEAEWPKYNIEGLWRTRIEGGKSDIQISTLVKIFEKGLGKKLILKAA